MRLIASILNRVGVLFFLVTWIAGIVLASGFWSTTISVVFPFWSWYLLVERLMKMLGLI